MACWDHLQPKYSSPPVLLPSIRSYVAIGTCLQVGNSTYRLLGIDKHDDLILNLLKPLAACNRITTPHDIIGAGKTYKEVVQTGIVQSMKRCSPMEIILIQTTKQLEDNVIGDASTFIRHIRFRDDGSDIQDWTDFPCSHEDYCSTDCSTVRFIYEGLSCLVDTIGHILNKRQLRECDRKSLDINPASWSFLKRYFDTTTVETSPKFSTKRKRLEEGFVQKLYTCQRAGEYLRLSTRSELERLAQLLGPTAVCGIRRQPQKEAWIFGDTGLVNIVHSSLEYREDYNSNGDWVRRTQSPGIDIFTDGHLARVYVRYRLVTIREGDEWPGNYLKQCAQFDLSSDNKRAGPPLKLLVGSQYEDDNGSLFKVLRYDPSSMTAVVRSEDNVERSVSSLLELNNIAEKIDKYLS